jgi:hypothetical protein
MGYTITFYALESQAFARQLLGSTEDVLQKIDERLRQQSPENDAARETLLEAARAICNNNLPPECGWEHFHALAWLAEVTSERVPICPFQDFRHLSYLDDIGIWPWLERFKPPFAVPKVQEDVPQVGFLPADEIESFALPEFDRLPFTDDRDVANARDEFRDVLETLVADRLDLLALLM